MQTFNDIWKKRKALLQNKTWNGADPKSGFDLEHWLSGNNIDPYQPFGRNSNDLSIRDFRNVLADLQQGELSEHLDPNEFTVNTINSNPVTLFILTPSPKTKHQITIVANGYAEQAQFTIYTEGSVYSVSWYKRRGKIDSIIDTEYGHPIDLEDFTDILVELGLEEPYQPLED